MKEIRYIKVYIAGKITGNEFYKQQFDELAEWLKTVYPNVTVINPAVLPQGMSNADYARICFSMIDSADLVVFSHDIADSRGAQLELEYCDYTDKPYAVMSDKSNGDDLCPECHREVSIGYACGEYFVIGSGANCPLCDCFKVMRNSEVDELNCWAVQKAMWIAEKAEHLTEATECIWVDDWLNYPFYKCCSCGYVFVGNANYCESCGKRIIGERGAKDGNMAE